MQIFFRQRWAGLSKALLLAAAAAPLLVMLRGVPLRAQTLARPGWAGSGLTPEPWWRHAVIYRLDDGRLPTLSQLPSLQAFGIDAVLLTAQAMQPVVGTASVEGVPGLSATEAPLTLDDFLFECSRLRIRVLVPLDVGAQDRESVMALAKSWMYRGAAGFVLVGVDKLPRVMGDEAGNVTPGPVRLHRRPVAPVVRLAAAEPVLVPDLRKLLAGYPGDRILVGESTGDPIANAMPSLQLRIVSLGTAPSKDPGTAARLAAYSSLTSPRPLLSLDLSSGSQKTMTPVDAALLLAGDQPAILDSSLVTPELLVRVFPPLASMKPVETLKPAEPPAPPKPAKEVYGAYKPYVAAENPAVMERKRKAEAEKAETEKQNIVLDTFPVQPLYQAISDTPEGAVAFYHRLIQLHRSNATLHDGTLYEMEAPQGLAWSALHAGSAPVVVVCNTSDAEIQVDLSDDLRKLKMGRNTARTLLHTGAASGMVPVEAITVPAHGVYVGELERGAYGR